MFFSCFLACTTALPAITIFSLDVIVSEIKCVAKGVQCEECGVRVTRKLRL